MTDSPLLQGFDLLPGQTLTSWTDENGVTIFRIEASDPDNQWENDPLVPYYAAPITQIFVKEPE